MARKSVATWHVGCDTRSHDRQKVSLTRVASFVSGLQGAYFVATGLWPLLHMRSFLSVTGPKTDLWLVRSFGLLVTAVGLALLHACVTRAPRSALPFGLSTAAALILADFLASHAVSLAYLLDVVPEVFFIGAWLFVLRRSRLASVRAPSSGSRHVQ
ncbi:MAG TPA: hypothetical protein VHV51_02695 [Polyangiaceae bacterium]|jgi:hypothetical protein|nr:hypothetical protein [Polyangiaceae bacterium]